MESSIQVPARAVLSAFLRVKLVVTLPAHTDQVAWVEGQLWVCTKMLDVMYGDSLPGPAIAAAHPAHITVPPEHSGPNPLPLW